MSDKGIIFSAPMVRALLDGRKSQTRRVLKLPTKTYSGGPIYERKDMGGWAATMIGGHGCFTIDRDGKRLPSPERPAIWHQTTGTTIALPYAIDDRLWVREAAAWVTSKGWKYRADNDDLTEAREAGEVGRWRPSIHMPRTASRLTLIVTDVRAQPLHEISEADALAEGIERQEPTDQDREWAQQYAEENGCLPDMGGVWIAPGTRQGWGATQEMRDRPEWGPTAAFAFRCLWNSLHGPEAWAANPWVAAITFETHRCNIDQMARAA